MMTTWIFRAPSPPPKRARKNDDNNDVPELSNQLQGELARLPCRFLVNFDPVNPMPGSSTVHLLCRLGMD